MGINAASEAADRPLDSRVDGIRDISDEDVGDERDCSALAAPPTATCIYSQPLRGRRWQGWAGPTRQAALLAASETGAQVGLEEGRHQGGHLRRQRVAPD
eukprot:1108013-Pyramimonas_sp.AAC.1